MELGFLQALGKGQVSVESKVKLFTFAGNFPHYPAMKGREGVAYSVRELADRYCSLDSASMAGRICTALG